MWLGHWTENGDCSLSSHELEGGTGASPQPHMDHPLCTVESFIFTRVTSTARALWWLLVTDGTARLWHVSESVGTRTCLHPGLG